INQRDDAVKKFIPIASEKESLFFARAAGIQTKRDAWVIGYSKIKTKENVYRMIENYHYELNRLSHITNLIEKRDNMNKNEDFIKWGDRLRKRFLNGDKILLEDSNLMQCL